MESTSGKGTLGFRELLSLAVGQVIGAGVVTLVGQAIGVTGRSVWLAYVFAVVLGLCIIFPYIMLSSMIRVNGGNYTFVATILGERWGGMYGMAFTLNSFACGMFGLGLGTYLNALFPSVNIKITAVIAITLFWIANMLGVKFMAKIQNVMSACLLVGLAVFIVVGLFNLRPGTFDFSSPEFFTGGASGFFNGTLLLVFSCTGQSFIVAFSKEAKNPRRDVPFAIIAASGVILVVYGLIAVVASGVLPIDQVAGKPLTLAAGQILSRPLYYAFIIGGPIMALATTLNSSFTVFSRPFHQMARDGWFSKKMAVTNNLGAPYILLTVIYIISVVPVLLNFSISTITSNSILISRISDVVAIVAVICLPKRIPDAWENRYFKISKPAFYALMIFCLCVTLFVIGLSLRNLKPTLVIVTVVLITLFFIYSTLRQKSGKVQMEKSYELQ
ncbi:amino acid permease [Lacrimispora amygdalina]|uniref:Amino acid permease n=1 Tax=Lacrimispora amygdalina TaxID=253257 RepID=A0A3E2NDC0_9FIRM|nr:APC family permease [Clostridium indicum]RFZ79008.1 amino acid permease [Clostridium indicum]